jgi:integrase
VAVVDRWHYARAAAGERCLEHKMAPTRQHGTGRRWQVRWRDMTGTQRKRSFSLKTHADQWDLKVKSDLARGSYVDPRNPTTLGDYTLRWLEMRPHRASTRRRMLGLVLTHIVNVPLGSRRLAAVMPSEVQAWAHNRGRHLGPAVLRQLVSTLRSVYKDAVLDNLVGSNPVVRVKIPRQEREQVVPLTVDQVNALADAMPLRFRAMVITQAGLGLRLGELIGLRVGDVDFLRRTVRIDSQMNDRGERAELKTRASRRTLPLPTVVADALAAHLAQFPTGVDGLIFCTRIGSPHRHTTYAQRAFKAAVREAGLPSSTSTHDLRHAYASWLIAAGEDVAMIAKRLGHSNAGMVISTYAHAVPGGEDRTRKAIDGTFGDAPKAGLEPDPASRRA